MLGILLNKVIGFIFFLFFFLQVYMSRKERSTNLEKRKRPILSKSYQHKLVQFKVFIII